MSEPEQFEVLILGSGEGGKKVAWHMARSGRRTAVVERRNRGLLSQHRLLAKQERDLECEGRASDAARSAVRHDDRRSRQDRYGEGPPAQAEYGRGRDCAASASLSDNRRRIDHGDRALCGAEDARGTPQ